MSNSAHPTQTPPKETKKGKKKEITMKRKGNKLKQNPQRIPQAQHNIIQQHLILISTSNNIEHNIALHLKHDDPIVVQNHVARLLIRLLQQSLLERPLLFQRRVGVDARLVGLCRRGCGGWGGGGLEVWGGVVFGEDSGAIVRRHD